MWIVIRLVLAAIGFAIRIFAPRRGLGTAQMAGDTPVYVNVHRSKGRRIVGFTIAIERKTPTWIRLHAENAIDRTFKAIGIANELQTGDSAFDRKVYVTCDHPHVATVLTESPDLRRAIVAMLDDGFRKIVFDGTTVRADRRASEEPSGNELLALKAVSDAAWRLSEPPPSRAGDPFVWKALVVEGVIWSIGGYAIGAAIELAAVREDVHLATGPLWQTGILVALVGFLALLAVIVLWMRGSSRGHRVIVESVLVLLLALPVTSMQAVADTNRALDNAAPTIVERTYTRCETRRHRSRRSTRYSYHLYLSPPGNGDGPTLPSEIQITGSLCTAAQGSGVATMAIGPGRWGIPWYRWIRIGAQTWTAPMTP